MLKEKYESFMELMKVTYDNIYSEEKDEFSVQDTMTLILFGIALDSLCVTIKDELEKKKD